MPSSVMRMPRSVLWDTALRIARDHPLLGIGPDNFRHTYGRYLGLAVWDTRVHANNTYLETLTGMGAAGALALAWLMLAALTSTRRLIAQARGEQVALVAAAAAACLAIAVHGLVDSFLAFTPTYVAFAIAAGVLFRRSEPSAPSAALDSSARSAEA
jgi:O-antigen ligase